MGRVVATDTTGAPEDVLSKAKSMILANLLDDHCYGEKAATSATGKKRLMEANSTTAKFCIPSVVHSFLRRLNDTQNLVSMTMKFETKTLAVVQGSQRRMTTRPPSNRF